jgi:type IV secretory pathway TraG/TraD family ATPase VirD4
VARRPLPARGAHQCAPPRRDALFIRYKAGEIAALKSVIATCLRLAIFEAMNGPEGDLKLWFIVDELDALGAIDGLKDALARLRKFGERCVLGFQSIAQVSSLYGRGDAQTIVENCANTLILRCSASEGGGTAAFASHLIGQRELLRAHTSESESRDGGFLSPRRYSKTQSFQHVTEYAVMPAELEQLPDLTGYLKPASRPHWLRIGIRQQ